jgi:hypothetical protein
MTIKERMKVAVRPRTMDSSCYRAGYVFGMTAYAGRVGEVSTVYADGTFRIKEFGSWLWSEDMVAVLGSDETLSFYKDIYKVKI